MRSFIYILITITCFLSSALSLVAQQDNGELMPGKILKSEITPDEKHMFIVDLDKNQFAIFKLMQIGVDLSITTFSPQGDQLDFFDSPNGQNGPEFFTITSAEKGKYKIEVSPLNEIPNSGKYDLQIQKISPKATSLEDKVDELFAIWDSKDSPGATVAVAEGDKILYKQGYGMANLEYDIPNNPSTIFHIASISKQFTVFSILLLEEDGKLSLEDDIRKYIPEVPDFGTTITLQHLASHTSGLRDQWNLLAMAGWRLDDVITKDHVLRLVSKQKELNFEPGEEFAYCNTGFTLLAEVVARVSGKSFAEFTEERIFKPLGMNNTLFYDDHEKIVKNRAYSYYADQQGFKKSVLSYANVGATSLFTTVEDLSLWAMNFSTLIVGSKGIVSKMNTKAKLNSGEEFGGALGQFVGKYKGLNEIQHGGADAGFRTYLTRFPDEDFTVAVFSNDAGFNPGLLAHKTADIYLQDKIEEEPKVEKAAEADAIVDPMVEISESQMTLYTGKYELQPGFIITIELENGKLFGQATGQGKLELESETATEWKVKGIDAKIVFNQKEGEKAHSITLHQSGQKMDAPRTEEFDPSSVDLNPFIGTYRSEELSTEYDFVITDNELKAVHFRLGEIALTPIKEDFFTGSTWYFGQIEFTRDASGEISGCKVSSGRVRNLKFDKIK